MEGPDEYVLGLGSSLKGILPEEGGNIFSNPVPKDLADSSMIQTPGWDWGRASSYSLGARLGMRPEAKKCCFTLSASYTEMLIIYNETIKPNERHEM